MADETLFSYEASGSRQEVAASLRAVAAQLSGTGPITLAAGEERVTVNPAADVEFEVEVEREAVEDGNDGDAVELEFELEWTETGSDEPPATRQTTDSPQTTDSADEPGQAAGDAESDDGTDAAATVDFEAVEAPDEPDADVVESVGSQATFEVFRDAAGEWRWRLVHRNGNIVATSGEGYTRRRNAEKGLRSVVANAPGAEVVDDLE